MRGRKTDTGKLDKSNYRTYKYTHMQNLYVVVYLIQALITGEANRVLYRKGAVIEVAGLLNFRTYGV